jgi:hypothetical protein
VALAAADAADLRPGGVRESMLMRRLDVADGLVG